LEVQNDVWSKPVKQISMESTKTHKKKFQFGDYVLWFSKGEKTQLGKFKKKWFGPFQGIVLLTQ
jgi:hypothetical protein